MLRRTERATAREIKIKQEQRSKIRETRVSNHNLFLLTIAPPFEILLVRKHFR